MSERRAAVTATATATAAANVRPRTRKMETATHYADRRSSGLVPRSDSTRDLYASTVPAPVKLAKHTKPTVRRSKSTLAARPRDQYPPSLDPSRSMYLQDANAYPAGLAAPDIDRRLGTMQNKRNSLTASHSAGSISSMRMYGSSASLHSQASGPSGSPAAHRSPSRRSQRTSNALLDSNATIRQQMSRSPASATLGLQSNDAGRPTQSNLTSSDMQSLHSVSTANSGREPHQNIPLDRSFSMRNQQRKQVYYPRPRSQAFNTGASNNNFVQIATMNNFNKNHSNKQSALIGDQEQNQDPSRTLENPNFPKQQPNAFNNNQRNILRDNTNLHNRTRSNESIGSSRNNAFFTKPSANSYGPLAPPMTPYQIQRKQMKSSFVFANGERFTPRNKFPYSGSYDSDYKGSNISRYDDSTNPSNRTQKDSPDVINNKSMTVDIDNIPTVEIKVKGPKTNKFNAFMKRILSGKKNTMKELPEIPEQIEKLDSSPETPYLTGSETVASNGSNDELAMFNRLKATWGKLNFDENSFGGDSSLASLTSLSSSPSHNHTSLNFTDTPPSSAPSLASDTNKTKSLRFADEVFITLTWSPWEYVRSTEEYMDNITPENGTVARESNAFHKAEIKRELNEYKRKEMVIHRDSLQYTHFFV